MGAVVLLVAWAAIVVSWLAVVAYDTWRTRRDVGTRVPRAVVRRRNRTAAARISAS